MDITHLPAPDLHLPGTGEAELRWGIIGPGWIAGEFAQALRDHTRQRVTAVASRSAERSAAFAARHGIAHALGSTEELVAHPEVDVVYIATPPSAHLEGALAAIAAGKHVLVEKPLATTAADARTLVAAARAAGVLLMEAMWSRYQPQTSVIRTLLADGVLGEIRSVRADHGQAIPIEQAARLHLPELGGGALLDLGIYPIQLSSMVLGAPDSLEVTGAMTPTGVDAWSALVLTHAGDARSTLYTSLEERTPTTASISGTAAHIAMEGPFHMPGSFTLRPADHSAPEIRWSDPTPLRGFAALSWEANAFATYVAEGRLESPLHTHEETVSILATIDAAIAGIARSEQLAAVPA